MSYRFRSKSKRRKKTLSEKFEIGAGRFVHDVQFSFSTKDDKSLNYSSKSLLIDDDSKCLQNKNESIDNKNLTGVDMLTM